MEIVKQIKEICTETGNEWFLTHSFTQIALCDLQLNEKLEKERNIFIFNDCECNCLTDKTTECIKCYVETERDNEFEKFNLNKICSNIYDFNTCMYKKSKWIIPDTIEGKIPGFILIKCCGDDIKGDFTHCLEFACVRPEYRKKGILKNMVNLLPKNWNIWLEAYSREINNIENIWEKCGFQYHNTINKKHLIYKKMSEFYDSS